MLHDNEDTLDNGPARRMAEVEKLAVFQAADELGPIPSGGTERLDTASRFQRSACIQHPRGKTDPEGS